MKVIVTHYAKASNGISTQYFNDKPVSQVTTVSLPLKFKFGSYNEPRKVFNDKGFCINADDIISIVAEGELNMSDH